MCWSCSVCTFCVDVVTSVGLVVCCVYCWCSVVLLALLPAHTLPCAIILDVFFLLQADQTRTTESSTLGCGSLPTSRRLPTRTSGTMTPPSHPRSWSTGLRDAPCMSLPSTSQWPVWRVWVLEMWLRRQIMKRYLRSVWWLLQVLCLWLMVFIALVIIMMIYVNLTLCSRISHLH